MKIAVTYENGQVFQHFGHCEQFKLYDAADDAVTSSQVVSAVGSGHGALAGFLQSHGVDTLICGGIGARAVRAPAPMPPQIRASTPWLWRKPARAPWPLPAALTTWEEVTAPSAASYSLNCSQWPKC